MAEQNTPTERKTFKYGDKTYYVDDLLKLHADLKHYFMNFARDKGRYSDENLEKLQLAIKSRIDVASTSGNFNADGSLAEDEVLNVKNTTYEHTGLLGLRKKAVYTKQDNTEWAKHYIHKLVGNLKPIEEELKTGINYDPAKHSFNALIQSKNITPESLYLYDTRNGDNPRTYSQRGKLLTDLIQLHYDALNKYNIQFEKDGDVYNDNYLTNLGNTLSIIQASDYQWTPDNMRTTLLALNLGDNWNNAFLTTDFLVGRTNDEVELANLKVLKQARLAKEKAEREALQEKINAEGRKIYDNAHKHYQSAKRLADEVELENVYGLYRMDPDKILFVYSQLGSDVQENLGKFTHETNNTGFNSNLSPAPMSYLYPWLWALYLKNPNDESIVRKTKINGVEYYYSPKLAVDDNYAYYLYNPNKNTITRTFKYDIPEYIDELKKLIGQRFNQSTPFDKKGGILKALLGGYATYKYHSPEQSLTSKNTSTDNSLNQSQEQNRVIVDKHDDGSVDFNLTNNDWIDLGLAAVNISSILLPPVTGAVTGAASSIGLFANDWNRDGFQWSDAGNLITNLGMDALGMIPIFGDALGTVGKVKRTLLPLIPKIIGGLGTLNAIQNTPQIIDSFKKIIDDRDMTKLDWENIAQGINLLVTGKNQYSVHKKTKDALTFATSGGNKDNVVLDVRNTKKKLEKIRVTGDPAKKIKDADGDPVKIKNALNETDLFRGYTPVLKGTGPKLQWIYGKKSDNKGWRWPIYMSDGKVKTQEDYNLDDYIDGLGKTTGLERRMVKSKELRTGKSLAERSEKETLIINDAIKLKDSEAQKIKTKKPNFESANREINDNRAKMKTNLTKPKKAAEEDIPPIFDLILQNAAIRNNKIKEYLKYKLNKRKKEKLENEIKKLKNITSVRISKDQKVNVTPENKQGGTLDMNKLNKFLNDGKR